MLRTNKNNSTAALHIEAPVANKALRYAFLAMLSLIASFGLNVLLSAQSEAATITAATRKQQIINNGWNCGGINQGNNGGAGGLVVIYAEQESNKSQRTAMTWNHGAKVNIKTMNPKKGGVFYNQPNNLNDMNNVKHNIDFGTGQQSACPNETVLSGWANNWAINCAHSLFNNGKRQAFSVEGQGRPKDADGNLLPAGGNWTTEIVSPRNGLTTVVVTTYKYKKPPSTNWSLWPSTSRINPSGDNNEIKKSQKNSVNFKHSINRQGNYTGNIAVRVTLRAIAYDEDGNIYGANNGVTDEDGVTYKIFEGQNIPKSSGFSRDSVDVTGNRAPIKDWNLGEGDKYCEWIRVNPDSNARDDWDESVPKCVRITGEWNSQATQQITRSNGHGGTGSRSSGVVASASGANNAQYSDAWVGETYKMSHTLRNTGPDITESPVLMQGWLVPMGASGGVLDNNTNTPQGIGVNQVISTYPKQRTILASDVSTPTRQTCTQIYWIPANSDDDHRDTSLGDRSGLNCVQVPYYYEINPSVTTTGSDTLEQGKNVDFSGYGNIPIKTGDRYNTNSRNATWTFTKRITKPDGTVETGNVDSGTKVFSPQNGESSSNKLSDHSIDTAAYPVGTRVCIGLTITQANHAGATKSAPEKCVDIVKSPKVQFQNADVRVGRNFRDNNSCTTNPEAQILTTGVPAWAPNDATRNMYGSWVEYGAFAASNITGFGSAATPTGMSWTSDPPNKLTFANTTANATTFVSGGKFKFNSQCQPDYFGRVDAEEGKKSTIADAVPGGDIDVDLASAAIENGKYVIEGKNINISGNIPSGKDITIYAKRDGSNGGKVTITGNIQYPDGPIAPNDIPRLVILSDEDLTIKSDVERVDAWLITKQSLNTCDKNSGEKLVENGKCSKRLIVNGPVSVKELGLYRTYGSDSTKPETYGKAAEVFNLRPDQILTQYFKENPSGVKQQATSVYEVELPPRY